MPTGCFMYEVAHIPSCFVKLTKHSYTSVYFQGPTQQLSDFVWTCNVNAVFIVCVWLSCNYKCNLEIKSTF